MIYRDSDWNMDIAIQIDERTFRLMPYEKYVKSNEIVHLIDVGDKNKFGDIDIGMARLAKEFLDTPYDFMGFVGMAIVKLAKFFKRKIKNPLASSSSVICSEGATLALQYGGCPEADSLHAASTSPQDLLNFLMKKG